MGRALAFLAPFISVVGGCVALVTWLDAQDVSLGVLAAVILGISVLLAVIRGLIFDWERVGLWLRLFTPLVALGIGVLGSIGTGDTGEDISFLVLSTAIFAGAAGPLALDLRKADQASRKQCPDCCETVKVAARVCRYCGYRWRDLEQGGMRI